MSTPPPTSEAGPIDNGPGDDLERVAVARVCPECGVEYDLATRFCPTDGSPLRPRLDVADPLVGHIIAERYRVTRRLGEGGMGRVYLAEHIKMGRKCAVKVMSARLVNDADSVRRFAREASNAARILHPNVATVFDYGESDGLVYLVMEYVDGEPLSRVLRRDGPLAPWRALSIAKQVAEALAAAHELGIVHRDLKPDNVLIAQSVSGREVAKVVDFGIAKAVAGPDSGDDALTRTGLVVGTPEYMSPEQLLGDPVDARTDLYALGCIVFQMLTGALPFGAPTREQIVKRRLAEDPPRLRTIIPALPESLERTVATLLGRSPGTRFRTATDAAQALDPAAALGPRWDPDFRPALREEPTEVLLAYAPTQSFALARRIAAGRLVPWITAGVLLVAIVALLVRRAALPDHGTTPTVLAPPPAAASAVPADSAHVTPSSASTAAGTVRPESTTAAARTDSASPRSATSNVGVSPPRSLQRPIDTYARALESGDPARVQSAYPAISSSQLDLLGANFFALAEHIRARPSYRAYAITGAVARVDFVLRLTYDYRTSHLPSSSATSYRATLVNDRGEWKIQQLEQR